MANNFSERYTDLEKAILHHLYTNPNPQPEHSTYNLASALVLQHIQEADREGDELRMKIQAAHSEVQRAIESLILKRLVRGSREADHTMVHFKKIKLTAKGEAKAIQFMRNREEADVHRGVDVGRLEELDSSPPARGDGASPPPTEHGANLRPSFIRPGMGGDCTITLQSPSEVWQKVYRSEEDAWTEAIEMGLIDRNNPRGQHGDPAMHRLLRALAPEVKIERAELKNREFKNYRT